MGIAFIPSLELPGRHKKVTGRAKPITQAPLYPSYAQHPAFRHSSFPASRLTSGYCDFGLRILGFLGKKLFQRIGIQHGYQYSIFNSQ